MQDVEVADRPESRRDLAQALAVALRPVGRYASPKTRHAARIRRVATRIPWSSSGSAPSRVPGFAGDHPGEVEAEHLPAGLGDVVVGQDAGRLADDEALAVAGGLGLGRGGGCRLRRGLPAGASRRATAGLGRRPGGAAGRGLAASSTVLRRRRRPRRLPPRPADRRRAGASPSRTAFATPFGDSLPSSAEVAARAASSFDPVAGMRPSSASKIGRSSIEPRLVARRSARPRARRSGG